MTDRAALLAAVLALCACGDASSPVVQTGPVLALTRVAHRDLACTGTCGVKLTYEARRVDSGAPAAAELRLEGAGSFPSRVYTTLPDGRVTFYWEYPRPEVSGTSYQLAICPPAGACASLTATIHFPQTGP
jgi:hypothetical protein